MNAIMERIEHGPATFGPEARARLFRLVLACALAVLLCSGVARAQDEAAQDEAAQAQPAEDTAAQAEPVEAFDPGTMDFDQCVHTALHRSPFLAASGIEIEIRRLDESDAFYQYFPDFRLTVGRVVSGGDDSDRPVSFSIRSGTYDPLEAYFSVQASRLITQVAILEHLQNISEGIYKLGHAFLEMNYLERVILFQEEIVALARHKRDYVDKLVKSGTATSLEYRIAEQEVEMALLEIEKLQLAQVNLRDTVRIILGMDLDQTLDVDLRDADLQVMGGFDPYQMEVATAKGNSIDLKIEEHMHALQEYNILLAYSKFVPTFSGGVTTTDQINSDDSGFYFTVGFTTPLWDWGERFRNVSRQKYRLAQQEAKTDLMELQFDASWRALLNARKDAFAEVKMARAQAELASLKKRQAEISYHAGNMNFPNYLDQIVRYFDAQKTVLEKELRHDKAMLELRYVSGDLYKRYVDAGLY